MSNKESYYCDNISAGLTYAWVNLFKFRIQATTGVLWNVYDLGA